jgi:hypothetical protein
VKSVLVLVACMILGFVYEITLGYSYSLSGQLAVATQVVIHQLNVPTMIWFAMWAILIFAPIAALAAYVLLRLQPRPLVLGIVFFLIPVLVIRLFGHSVWRRFDYEASYFVGNYAELFSVFLLPLIFLWVWNYRGRRATAE